jgi:hypothetical protein
MVEAICFGSLCVAFIASVVYFESCFEMEQGNFKLHNIYDLSINSGDSSVKTKLRIYLSKISIMLNHRTVRFVYPAEQQNTEIGIF